MNLFLLACLAFAPLEIIPAPQFVEADIDKTFEIRRTTPVILADDATATERAQLQVLFDALGFELPIETASAQSAGTAGVYVGEAARHSGIGHRKVRRRFADLREPGPQGYRLVIDAKGVVVAGTDPAGTFYGVSTLAQLAAHGPSLPYLQIRDEPDTPVRGVYVEGSLDNGSIRRLAALKCNLLVVESPDFYDLGKDKEELWASLSKTARHHHVELVPVIRTLDRAEDILKRHPHLAEGRIALGEVLLERDDWALLPRRNIIHTKVSPLVVRLDGRFCKENEDYVVDAGATAYPFDMLRSCARMFPLERRRVVPTTRKPRHS
jgi:hypothetical protein